MNPKMQAAMKKFQGAWDEFHNDMRGYEPMATEAQMKGAEMPAAMQMPTQEDGAEPGSYEGKGMMAGNKKAMLMASMKKKGY